MSIALPSVAKSRQENPPIGVDYSLSAYYLYLSYFGSIDVEVETVLATKMTGFRTFGLKF